MFNRMLKYLFKGTTIDGEGVVLFYQSSKFIADLMRWWFSLVFFFHTDIGARTKMVLD